MTLRLERAFGTIEELRKLGGHLYNWYDLHDLRVLEPAYVSTVDSGNLAGHLIALRQACLSLVDEPQDVRREEARVGRALETALSLAIERRRPSGGGAAGPAARGEPSDGVVEAVRAAKGEVAAALDGRSTAALDAALRAALAAAASEAEPDATRAWIAWASHRLEAHRQSVAARPPGEPGAARSTPGPTLRARAASSPPAAALVDRLERLASRSYAFALGMDFRFLYDGERKLFAIGFHEQNRTLDGSYYDLLASESRLASFVAVAKNDAPVEHWFRLGRTLTRAAGETALVSWSGSMFEYLMPRLVMESFPGTLLAQTHEGAVRRQIAYGAERGVPWGVSESAYNLRDRHFTYQYRAFGVPDLALKRGLGRDLVVAPYASAMAIMVDPGRALANLATLEELGALGPYGWRDALDFTRPASGQRFAVVQTYMAHHVGMAFVALTNALASDVWPRRFHADPLVRAAELLLHERVPRQLALRQAQETRADEPLAAGAPEEPAERIVDGIDAPSPHVALLGRLPYTMMVSHCGAGYSRYEDLAVTRWRADGTTDASGQFVYVADLTADRLWSATHQPVCAPPDQYRAVLATDRVTFHRVDGEIETRTEIVTSSEDAAEVRRVTLRNTGATPHELELTSYGEIVLGRPDADRAHPAFANLFVETEWHEWCSAITATRRPRSAKETPLWCVHVVDEGKERVGAVTCETDRARFLGRGRTTRDPVAVVSPGPLSGTTGPVLDPIFALRTRVRLEPGQTASVAFTTLVAPTRERAFALADRYKDPHAAQRALDLAWTSTQAELRELGVSAKEAGVFQDLAAHLFYANPALRASEEDLRRNRGAQPSLWAHGISGDWPILLATIDGAAGLPTLRQLFAAHRYWRRHGMTVDLVVLNLQPTGYLQELGDKISAGLFASGASEVVDRPGGVFLRRRDLFSAEDLLMLRATARVHLPCDGRPLGRVLAQLAAAPPRAPDEPRPGASPGTAPGRTAERRVAGGIVTRSGSRAHVPVRLAPSARPTPGERAQAPSAVRVDEPAADPGARVPPPGPALLFDNGTGGLAPDGRYRIQVAGDALPPAPWSNVVAGPRGGFVVTERGGGFCWAENSYFFRLTPWHNDPVSDPPGEVIYLRDDETGELWSATPAPVRQEAPFTIHHGAGSSTFEHDHAGVATRLTLGVADEGAVKISLLAITNGGTRPRRLSVTSFVEWTLGVVREHTQHQVRTSFDGARGAIFAQNSFDPQFAGWVAFSACSAALDGHSGDRRAFIGRNGSLAAPAALTGAPGGALDGVTGGGLDPCAALQTSFALAPGETREIAFLLGAAPGEEAARAAIARLGTVAAAQAAVAETTAAWAARLSVITVRTPDPAFDAMMNHWALYQALACRMWARSALYQSSGAYGFRDQLQDAMAFVYAEPALAREHVLRAAARQFVEGDVQHWWHPQSGRGVRTKFSDDLAWLPYVVDHYVRVTGDAAILDEQVPFLTMRPLGEDEHEVYDLPQVTSETASLHEHCLRALRRAFTAGAHGLPLIGIGDWNDGMSRVGVAGRGESVWLAWFLAATARGYAVYGDAAAAAELRARADGYVAAAEAHGWDGAWYRRAYFDDGTPLGSASNDECRIDSIAQSWSVISGGGAPARQAEAMRSFEAHLVDDEAGILRLLEPPFDKTSHDPGYIKGYLPGVRENGAQYTHAALWAVLATALRGDGDRAFELFQMLNPLLHTRTPEDVATYKVEPYVVAADVYTAAGHRGRGGWTWYTGSASWTYRVGLEALLGLGKRGDTLTFAPRVPRAWPGFSLEYRHGGSVY
jgi:cyclic beta-1,2-glucan synthetase